MNPETQIFRRLMRTYRLNVRSLLTRQRPIRCHLVFPRNRGGRIECALVSEHERESRRS